MDRDIEGIRTYFSLLCRQWRSHLFLLMDFRDIRRSNGGNVVEVGGEPVSPGREIAGDLDQAVGLITCERALFSHAARAGTARWIGAVCTKFRHQHIGKARRNYQADTKIAWGPWANACASDDLVCAAREKYASVMRAVRCSVFTPRRVHDLGKLMSVREINSNKKQSTDWQRHLQSDLAVHEICTVSFHSCHQCQSCCLYHLWEGLCITMGQHSSLCVSAVVLFLGGFDHMEVDEQDREQVDSERANTSARGERKKTKRGNNKCSNMWWHVQEWFCQTHTATPWATMWSVHKVKYVEKKTLVWGVSVNTTRRLQWFAIECKRNQLSQKSI